MSLRNFLNVSRIARLTPREGTGENNGGSGAGGQGGGDPPPPPPVAPPQPPAGGNVQFTPEQQAKFNTAVAEERRKAQEANRALVTELETRKTAQGTTEAEKTALQTRIDELTSTFTTKEEIAKTEYSKLEKKYKADTEKLTEEKKTWQNRFENKLKTIELRAAASEFGALRAEQVEKLLWDQTIVEQEVGEDGKPTGELVTMVNFIGKDKEGKPVKLKLSPRDAVKTMTDMTQEYGNLFETKAKGGPGGNPNQNGGNGALPNIENMTPQEWQTHRVKLRNQMAAQGG